MEKAREILVAEAELRLSPRIQQLMAEAEKDEVSDWIRVVHEVVEPEICTRFSISLSDKRLLLAHYPELEEVVFYAKYNRARPGLLKEGDGEVDVPMVGWTGGATTLLDCPLDRPLLVLAGSIS